MVKLYAEFTKAKSFKGQKIKGFVGIKTTKGYQARVQGVPISKIQKVKPLFTKIKKMDAVSAIKSL